MKGKGKGISASALPFKRTASKFACLSPVQTTELAVKLSKKGNILLHILFIHIPLHLHFQQSQTQNLKFLSNSPY